MLFSLPTVKREFDFVYKFDQWNNMLNKAVRLSDPPPELGCIPDASCTEAVEEVGAGTSNDVPTKSYPSMWASSKTTSNVSSRAEQANFFLHSRRAVVAPGTPRRGECRPAKSRALSSLPQCKLVPSECAVSFARPLFIRGLFGSSRLSTVNCQLSPSLTPLECAVEHPMKDLSASVNALECAVMENRALSPLECADPKTLRRNPFRMRSSEKRWGGGPAPFFARHSPLLL
jgi:hypothetical protein